MFPPCTPIFARGQRHLIIGTPARTNQSASRVNSQYSMAHKTKLLSRNHQNIYEYEQDPPEIVSRYQASKLSSFENSGQTHVTTKIKQPGNIKKRVIRCYLTRYFRL